jgi:hypothetical protein
MGERIEKGLEDFRGGGGAIDGAEGGAEAIEGQLAVLATGVRLHL